MAKVQGPRKPTEGREEAKLDREIACLETKARVGEKRERLRQLRAQTR